MKRIITLSLIIIGSFLYAQQRPHYSQYMINQFLVNPAVAGAEQHHELKFGNRSQWLGFQNSSTGDNVAPQTMYLSGHGHIGQHIGPNKHRHKNDDTQHHGVGGMVINDRTGPISRLALYASYAYNMGFTKEIRGSFGVHAGVQNYRIDGDQLRYGQNVTGINGSRSELKPDAAVGAWIYSEHFYVGGSMGQILQQKLSFELAEELDRQQTGNPSDTTGSSEIANTSRFENLRPHYFLTAGYNIALNPSYHLVPSFMMRFVSPLAPQIDLNCKIRYKIHPTKSDVIWSGVSFRTSTDLANATRDVVILVGATLSELVDFGYAFDYAISDINAYQKAGSHEIVLGLRLSPKSQVRSPSEFW